MSVMVTLSSLDRFFPASVGAQQLGSAGHLEECLKHFSDSSTYVYSFLIVSAQLQEAEVWAVVARLIAAWVQDQGISQESCCA